MKDNIFCINCGQELDAETKFCPECGTKIVKTETPKKRGRKKKEEVVAETTIEENKNEVVEVTKLNDNDLKKQEELEEALSLKEKELKKAKRGKFIAPILSCVITFALCLVAFGFFYEYYLENLVIETTKREVTVTDKGIAEAVEKVYDSVVVVESYYKNQLYSTGTGFVYKTTDDKAYILTNHHVIEQSDEVRVVFTNNETEEVKIVGSDELSDVAVLSIDKDKIISVAELGSSEELKVGDTAFAVGAPLDSSTYAWTVTRGVISGKNRTVVTSSSVMEVLQTDTAINSGNSGGPLCNSNGQVIGITNMKLASSAIEGMGFAIPIETAISNAETLIEGKEIARPYIGVSISEARKSYYSNETYVIVNSVEKNGAAAEAGIKAGDIIKKVEDKEITTIVYFQYELYKHDIGDKVKITIERDGKEKTLVLTLGTKGKKA